MEEKKESQVKCFICHKLCERVRMVLSIVPLETEEGSETYRYYPVCPECWNKKELV
jgi:hypothetical protein